MLWKGRRESSNVEDTRSSGGGFSPSPGGGMRRPIRAGGTGSIGFLIVAGIVLWFLGINPMVLLQGGDLGSILNQVGGGQSTGGSSTSGSQSMSRPSTGSASEEEMVSFVKVVLADTEDTWGEIFKASGETYPPPTLVLFSDQTRSACGFASAASGPFYCPGDQKLYIDLAFYDELRQKFKAPGDFAQAYVIAHEVGHHIQNLTGVMEDFNRKRQQMSETQGLAMSVRVELQADCYAGIWGHYAAKKGMLEEGDLQEALVAATQIGDDAIQKRTQGYVVPESFSHGSSAQRKRWFSTGFKSGDISDCDTFTANPL